MKEGFVVFWLEPEPWFEGDERMRAAKCSFKLNEMPAALTFMESLRKAGVAQFITMASQTANMVGKTGTAGVTDGKLPNGEEYTYGKGDALSQRTKVYAKTVSADTIEVDMSVEP